MTKISKNTGFYIFIIWLISVTYIICHEAGHAIAIALCGEQITNIYINPLGLSGYVESIGPMNILIAIAGLAATTVLSAILLITSKCQYLGLYTAARTMLYAVNVQSGTDAFIAIQYGGELVLYLILGINAAMIMHICINALCRSKFAVHSLPVSHVHDKY